MNESVDETAFKRRKTVSPEGSRLDRILNGMNVLHAAYTREAMRVAEDSVKDDDTSSRKHLFATKDGKKRNHKSGHCINPECARELGPAFYQDYELTCQSCGVVNSMLPSCDVEERRTFMCSENGEDKDRRRTEHYSREVQQQHVTLLEKYSSHPHISWAQTRLNQTQYICKVLVDNEGQNNMPLIDTWIALRVTLLTKLMVMHVLDHTATYVTVDDNGVKHFSLGSHVFWTLTLLRQAFAERTGYKCPTAAIASYWDMSHMRDFLDIWARDRFSTNENLENATKVGKDSGLARIHGTSAEHKMRTLLVNELPGHLRDRDKITKQMNFLFMKSHIQNAAGFHIEVLRMHTPTVDSN